MKHRVPIIPDYRFARFDDPDTDEGALDNRTLLIVVLLLILVAAAGIIHIH